MKWLIFYLTDIAGQTYTADESPVYIDDNGEGVTDLAYHAPLTDMGINLFDSKTGGEIPDFGSGLDGAGFADNDEFVSGGERGLFLSVMLHVYSVYRRGKYVSRE